MKLAEIFPDLNPHLVYPSARELARLGLVKTPARDTNYSPREAEILSAYVSLIAEKKYSPARALGLIVTRFAKRSSALSSGGADLEKLREEKEDAERREHLMISEMARIRNQFEMFRRETADLRRDLEKEKKAAADQIRDLDEERNKARHRIARLEETIRDSRPKGIWERIKAAVRVFLGEGAVIYALPESAESLRKAA